jgi:uncharacterized protein (DUF924 family)
MHTSTVLDFWFLPRSAEAYGKPRAEWFRKDETFDRLISTQFGEQIEQAVNGGLREWDAEGPRGMLARIIVLDQFTRNTGRNTPAAFAGDVLALAAARHLVDTGMDRELHPIERWFAYLPFEHAEDAAMQELSVALYTALAEQHAGYDGALDYAHRHRGVIARFGRFPHRNPILGRTSTAEELDYLAQPGAGF